RPVLLRGAGEQEADLRLPLVPEQPEGVVLVLLRQPRLAGPPLADDVRVAARLQLRDLHPGFERDRLAGGEAEVDAWQLALADGQPGAGEGAGGVGRGERGVSGRPRAGGLAVVEVPDGDRL